MPAAAAPAVKTLCALCGLDAGLSPIVEADRRFCCPGCQSVYAVLRQSGQSLEFAAPAPAGAEAGEILELALTVDGMWCTSCAWLLERALRAERGVLRADALFTSDLVKVSFYPRYLPPARIRERIAQLGYRVSGQAAPDRYRSAQRDLHLRLGVAGFLWLNVMTLSMIFYVGYFEPVAPSMNRYIPLLLAALTAPAVFYSAWPVLRAAAAGLREGVLRMEALLSLGILAAYGYSTALAFAGGTHYYFDTACAIITFVLGGKLIEAGAKERTARAVALLHQMMPRKARLAGDGERERFVAVEQLAPGDCFFVKPGERIPADGIVDGGQSLVDESVITGESRPLARGPGDPVVGGSLATSGALTVRATQPAGRGTLHDMIQTVERALNSRSRIERTVDRVARAFVPAVMLIAAAAFLYWRHDPSQALINSISVLVIACPCALGLATPLAISAAVGAASRHGILINHADVFENASGIDTVVFDKTGTVTEGRFRMVHFASAGASEREALERIAPLEAASEHPLARAVLDRAAELGIPSPPPAGGVERVPGQGLRRGDIFVGSAQLAGAVPDSKALDWQRQGLTTLYAGWGGQVRATFALGDRIRQDAPSVFAALHRQGLDTAILSGDAVATTAAAAGVLGARRFQAEVTPDGKLAHLAALQATGRRVAMIGDGINDAPALAAANLGIAMGTGAALAMEAAPVVLMTPSLESVPAVFDLAAQTIRAVRRNLFWAFIYNTAGISLAVAGILNPILAAGAMLLSSLSVTIQSARLGRWQPPSG